MPKDIDPVPADVKAEFEQELERESSTWLDAVARALRDKSLPAPQHRPYPEPKQRELTDEEKHQLRDRIEQGNADIYALAKEFGCSSSQVAGIKAAMNR